MLIIPGSARGSPSLTQPLAQERSVPPLKREEGEGERERSGIADQVPGLWHFGTDKFNGLLFHPGVKPSLHKHFSQRLKTGHKTTVYCSPLFEDTAQLCGYLTWPPAPHVSQPLQGVSEYQDELGSSVTQPTRGRVSRSRVSPFPSTQ